MGLRGSPPQAAPQVAADATSHANHEEANLINNLASSDSVISTTTTTTSAGLLRRQSSPRSLAELGRNLEGNKKNGGNGNKNGGGGGKNGGHNNKSSNNNNNNSKNEGEKKKKWGGGKNKGKSADEKEHKGDKKGGNKGWGNKEGKKSDMDGEDEHGGEEETVEVSEKRGENGGSEKSSGRAKKVGNKSGNNVGSGNKKENGSKGDESSTKKVWGKKKNKGEGSKGQSNSKDDEEVEEQEVGPAGAGPGVDVEQEKNGSRDDDEEKSSKVAPKNASKNVTNSQGEGSNEKNEQFNNEKSQDHLKGGKNTKDTVQENTMSTPARERDEDDAFLPEEDEVEKGSAGAKSEDSNVKSGGGNSSDEKSGGGDGKPEGEYNKSQSGDEKSSEDVQSKIKGDDNTAVTREEEEVGPDEVQVKGGGSHDEAKVPKAEAKREGGGDSNPSKSKGSADEEEETIEAKSTNEKQWSAEGSAEGSADEQGNKSGSEDDAAAHKDGEGKEKSADGASDVEVKSIPSHDEGETQESNVKDESKDELEEKGSDDTDAASADDSADNSEDNKGSAASSDNVETRDNSGEDEPAKEGGQHSVGKSDDENKNGTGKGPSENSDGVKIKEYPAKNEGGSDENSEEGENEYEEEGEDKDLAKDSIDEIPEGAGHVVTKELDLGGVELNADESSDAVEEEESNDGMKGGKGGKSADVNVKDDKQDKSSDGHEYLAGGSGSNDKSYDETVEKKSEVGVESADHVELEVKSDDGSDDGDKEDTVVVKDAKAAGSEWGDADDDDAVTETKELATEEEVGGSKHEKKSTEWPDDDDSIEMSDVEVKKGEDGSADEVEAFSNEEGKSEWPEDDDSVEKSDVESGTKAVEEAKGGSGDVAEKSEWPSNDDSEASEMENKIGTALEEGDSVEGQAEGELTATDEGVRVEGGSDIKGFATVGLTHDKASIVVDDPPITGNVPLSEDDKAANAKGLAFDNLSCKDDAGSFIGSTDICREISVRNGVGCDSELYTVDLEASLASVFNGSTTGGDATLGEGSFGEISDGGGQVRVEEEVGGAEELDVEQEDDQRRRVASDGGGEMSLTSSYPAPMTEEGTSTEQVVVTIGTRYCPETCGIVSQCKAVRDHFRAKQLATFGSDSGTVAADVSEDSADDTAEFVESVDSADIEVGLREGEGEDGDQFNAIISDDGSSSDKFDEEEETGGTDEVGEDNVSDGKEADVPTCLDDPDFLYKDKPGFDCAYIGANKPEKCEKLHNNEKVGVLSCPVSCDMVAECEAIKEGVMIDESGDGVGEGGEAALSTDELDVTYVDEMVEADGDVEEGVTPEDEPSELLGDEEAVVEVSCEDNPDFLYKDKPGFTCAYIGANKPDKCEKLHNNEKIGVVSCPVSCYMVTECKEMYNVSGVVRERESGDVSSSDFEPSKDVDAGEEGSKDGLAKVGFPASDDGAGVFGEEKSKDEATKAEFSVSDDGMINNAAAFGEEESKDTKAEFSVSDDGMINNADAFGEEGLKDTKAEFSVSDDGMTSNQGMPYDDTGSPSANGWSADSEDTIPASSKCKDDPEFLYKEKQGYTCEFLGTMKPEKCSKLHNDVEIGLSSCPESCNMVDKCLEAAGDGAEGAVESSLLNKSDDTLSATAEGSTRMGDVSVDQFGQNSGNSADGAIESLNEQASGTKGSNDYDAFKSVGTKSMADEIQDAEYTKPNDDEFGEDFGQQDTIKDGTALGNSSGDSTAFGAVGGNTYGNNYDQSQQRTDDDEDDGHNSNSNEEYGEGVSEEDKSKLPWGEEEKSNDEWGSTQGSNDGGVAANDEWEDEWKGGSEDSEWGKEANTWKDEFAETNIANQEQFGASATGGYYDGGENSFSNAVPTNNIPSGGQDIDPVPSPASSNNDKYEWDYDDDDGFPTGLFVALLAILVFFVYRKTSQNRESNSRDCRGGYQRVQPGDHSKRW